MSADLLQPMLCAVLLWWVSTGAVIWLVGRPRHTFDWTALGATFGLACATIFLLALRDETTIRAAYAGFTVGIVMWAWHEIMFLLGFLSGPRKTDCPPNLAVWPRFLVSAETVIHHELAIAAHALVIAALSWGADNQIAAWTFFLLWGMRLTAKFVIFFGAPNITEHFLPDHLQYLKSYFSKRQNVAFWPFAMMLTTSAAAGLAFLALEAPSRSFEAAGFALLAALAGLAVLEHLALALPLPDDALWRWAVPQSMKKRRPSPTDWRK